MHKKSFGDWAPPDPLSGFKEAACSMERQGGAGKGQNGKREGSSPLGQFLNPPLELYELDC